MRKINGALIQIAKKYDLKLIYAFGSRSREALRVVTGKQQRLLSAMSDLDLAVKSGRTLSLNDKIEITGEFEELFSVLRVDLVILQEARAFLALEIIKGELLYAENPLMEAEYQLYVMRRAAELIPYERMKQQMIFGE